MDACCSPGFGRRMIMGSGTRQAITSDITQKLFSKLKRIGLPVHH